MAEIEINGVSIHYRIRGQGLETMEEVNRIHSRIARSKLAVIPRAGHTPTVEEPAVVNALLEDLFNPDG
jgi:pimeloyl-ACP methyl ester carboxylesterase